MAFRNLNRSRIFHSSAFNICREKHAPSKQSQRASPSVMRCCHTATSLLSSPIFRLYLFSGPAPHQDHGIVIIIPVEYFCFATAVLFYRCFSGSASAASFHPPMSANCNAKLQWRAKTGWYLFTRCNTFHVCVQQLHCLSLYIETDRINFRISRFYTFGIYTDGMPLPASVPRFLYRQHIQRRQVAVASISARWYLR